MANFQWLILPSLDEQPATRGMILNDGLQTRSMGQSVNPLNTLLTAIGGDVDNPPTLTRAMVYESDQRRNGLRKKLLLRCDLKLFD